METYGANDIYGNDVNPRLLVQEAIDAAENAGLDFSQFDNDDDGKVDAVTVIHAGYGEEAGAGSNTIWSHRWNLGSYSRTYDGVEINEYTIVPELFGNIGTMITSIGVICHEFGHILGLPDLYDTDGGSEGVGEWDLMGSGNWNNLGRTPSNLSAWCKAFIGWQTPQVISSPTKHDLLNASQNNTTYRINTLHSNEYFLLENRQSIGFDAALPGTGLCIWHINTNKTTSSHISANDVNADEDLKGVDLEEADGNNDLDNQTNRGDDGDLFPGAECNQTFNDNSNPNSRTYSPVVNTSKPITQIIEDDNIISFNYSGYGPILGPNLVCTSGSTFTITNRPPGTTVNWEKSNNLSYVSGGQGTNSYTVKAVSSSTYGWGWVEATIDCNCGDVTVRKDFWVGKFEATFVTGQAAVCPNSLYVYTAQVPIGNPSSYSYQWIYPSGWYNNSQWDNNILLQTPQYNMTYGTVRVKTTNACGTSGYSGITVYPGYNCGGYYMAAPNPSSSYVDIDIITEMLTSMAESYNNDISLSVYNKMGIVVLNSNVESLPYRIDTSELPNGEYVVKIITRKKGGTEKDQRFESLKIIVNH